MQGRAARWRQVFPYRGGNVVVERLPMEWRVELGEEEARARSLVSAFEALLGRPAADSELDVVLLALARDRAAEEAD
jgi:hypothetical protein